MEELSECIERHWIKLSRSAKGAEVAWKSAEVTLIWYDKRRAKTNGKMGEKGDLHFNLSMFFCVRVHKDNLIYGSMKSLLTGVIIYLMTVQMLQSELIE